MRSDSVPGPWKLSAARVAQVLSEVLAPAVTVTIVLLMVALHSAALGRALLIWLLSATFGVALPTAFVMRGVRLGHWSSHHVPERGRRLVPMLVGLGSLSVGGALLVAVGAPSEFRGAFFTGLLVSAVVTAITRWWKVSLHATVVAGGVAILALVYGPVLLTLAPLIGLIGWARVRLGEHTIAQVSVGAAIGAILTIVIFPLLR